MRQTSETWIKKIQDETRRDETRRDRNENGYFRIEKGEKKRQEKKRCHHNIYVAGSVGRHEVEESACPEPVPVPDPAAVPDEREMFARLSLLTGSRGRVHVRMWPVCRYRLYVSQSVLIYYSDRC